MAPTGLAKDDIKQAQTNDPTIRPIYEWFSKSIIPSPKEVSTCAPATRYYWLRALQLRFKDGLLLIEIPLESSAKLLLLQGGMSKFYLYYV